MAVKHWAGVRERAASVLRRAGMDRSVIFTVAGRVASTLSSAVSLVFVGYFLSTGQRGYYFTFNSLLAMQVLFELGLSWVIIHVGSHERSHLQWEKTATGKPFLEGDPSHKSRLASLLVMSTRWYVAIGVLMVAILIPAGIWFFDHYQHTTADFPWKGPWSLLVVASASNMLLTAFFSFLEGCGEVSQVAQARLVQSVSGSVLLWLVLFLGGGLLGPFVFLATQSVYGWTWLGRHYGPALKDLWRSYRREHALDWRKDIWPFQWKIAVSWLSGYFIFQIFNPILFAARGAEEAGRMGMTLAVLTGIQTIAMSWVLTKAPRFGNFIALGDIAGLHDLFRTSLRHAMKVCIAGCGLFWAVAVVLRAFHSPIGLKVIDPLPLLLMAISTVINGYLVGLATYLRSHRQEPFLWLSLAMGALNSILALVLSRPYGTLGLSLGFCAITLSVGLSGGSAIYRRKRTEWYGGAA